MAHFIPFQTSGSENLVYINVDNIVSAHDAGSMTFPAASGTFIGPATCIYSVQGTENFWFINCTLDTFLSLCRDRPT